MAHPQAKKLSAKKEAVALERYKKHERLAIKLARDMAAKSRRMDELEDLIQEARIGLWTAAIRFKESAGVKFWTYANWYVSGSLQHWMRDKAWVVRSPRIGADGKPLPSGKRWEFQPTSLENSDGLSEQVVDPNWNDGYEEVENNIAKAQALQVTGLTLRQRQFLNEVRIAELEGKTNLRDVLKRMKMKGGSASRIWKTIEQAISDKNRLNGSGDHGNCSMR